MVHVNTLEGFPIQIAHGLKTTVVSRTCISEIKDTHCPSAGPLCRDPDIPVHPQIAVPAGPALTPGNPSPAVKVYGNPGIYQLLFILAH